MGPAMRFNLCLGVVCTLVVAAAPTSAHAAPAWCKDGSDKPGFDPKTLFSESDPHDALRAIVAASCYPSSDIAGMTKQVDSLRASWSKKLGLADGDWGDVAEWAHLPVRERGAGSVEIRDRQAKWSAYSALDQLGALHRAEVSDTDAAYVADAFGAKLTQLGRLGYVKTCIETSKTDPAVVHAMCAADAAALDLAKLYAEIKADTTHSFTDQMTARLLAYDIVTTKVKPLLASMKATRGKDPAYETMWKLAEQAHAQWGSTDTKLLGLVADLDDARVSGSRKASAGCIARTWEGWKGVVATLPAKDLGAIHSEPGKEFGPQMLAMLTAQPNGYLAALALNMCATAEDKHDALTRWIGHALARWPGMRGPRTATQSAIVSAGLTLDKRDAEIEYPDVRRDWIQGDGNLGTAGAGAIKSAVVAGDTATVTFQKQKITQKRCTKGHSTNKIRAINADGTILYWYVCDKEITETIEVAPWPPAKVHARYVAGLKPGMTVRIADGVVFVAYPKGKTVPTLVTGVEVK